MTPGTGTRSHLYTVEDRASYLMDPQSAQAQREQVMSDQSLVEMFNHCKLDPSFVSNDSFTDSGMCQSRNDTTYQSQQGDSTGTSGYRTAAGSVMSPGYASMNNSKLKSGVKNGDRSSTGQSLNYDYVNVSCDQNVNDLKPAKISPLDPSKLWAEFNARLNFGSDTAINRSAGNSSIRVVPDHLRDITGMSLSYNCLSDPDFTSDTSRLHSLPDSTRLSETASSFFYQKKSDRSKQSLNASEGVSFSNLSLQLPDSSYNNRSRFAIQNHSVNNGGSYGDIQQFASHQRDRRSSDRQSLSSSDQGISSTDRGLSSSSSAVERSQRSFTSSGFQSEESNFSDQSPLYPTGFRHNPYHQSTPIVENEISTIFSVPSTIRTNRVSLDADVCPPGGLGLDTTPHLGGDKGRHTGQSAPNSSLFPSAGSGSTGDIISPSAADSGSDLSEAHINNSSQSSLEDSSSIQATIPYGENEISTIKSLPSTVRTKRVSTDADVCPPGYSCLSSGRKSFDSRDRLAGIPPIASPDSPQHLHNVSPTFNGIGMQSRSAFSTDDVCALPPLTVRSRSSSSDGSARASKFFKNPLTGGASSPEELSDEESTRYPHSISSTYHSNGSLQNETSSVSAMISNVSSSCMGASTLDTLSVDSCSLPHNRTLQSRSTSKETSFSEPPLYVNIGECSPGSHSSDTTDNTVSNTMTRSADTGRMSYLSSDPSEQTKLMELLAEMSNASDGKIDLPALSGQGDYENVGSLSSQEATDLEEFPIQVDGSAAGFSRDRVRASLDKESRDQLVRDVENMAPRKLYKLKSKAPEPKKKLSPMKITDYKNSPYKFRQPGQYSNSDYENLKNVSPSSLGSAFEDMKAVTPALYTDYVNFYDLSGERVGHCPIATPESLSDAVILEDSVDVYARLGKTFNVANETVRGEMDIDNLSQRSAELSRTKSPINTSGINSAFKPVKSRNSSYSRNSSNSISPGAESSSNWSSASGNRSNISSDRSSMSDCGDFKKPLPYGTQYSGCTEDNSLNWSRRSGLDSVSEAANSTYQKLNYLELVGKDPLSFSMSKCYGDETTSSLSKHSHTDSIPWEDSINKSAEYQALADQSLCKSSVRKPLKQLENTPKFSPIYGTQSVKATDELSCRKRYMSTPKLSSNTAMNLSDTSSDSRSASTLATPHRRDLRNKTFNNTSVWSCDNSDRSTSPGNNGRLYESCFSSLSKTTYI